jgi:putative thioredoxin
VDRVAALAGDGGLTEALEAAEQMLAEGAAVDAAETFAAILGEEPENAAAYGGLVRAHLALGEIGPRAGAAGCGPGEDQGQGDRGRTRADRTGTAGGQCRPGSRPARRRFEPIRKDRQARFDLALALHAKGKVDGGGG